MARAKKIDREVARAAALQAFWANGYQALGVRKLEELTGINRFMLQTEFGGKSGLFAEVLDIYISSWKREHLTRIAAGNIDQIAEYFLLRASDKFASDGCNGCLMINTICENYLDDPAISKRAQYFVEILQDSLSQALLNERAQGTLNDDVNIQECCEMLSTTLTGMNVLAKLSGSNQALLSSAQAVVSTVMSWRRIN